MPRLRRSDPSQPGLRRRRRGRGFSYAGADGTAVRDAQTLARIEALVIPPAWEDVWICPHPNGHIQATGVDARGRTQYLYHEQWRRQRDREKFDHMLEFARALPGLRVAVAEDLEGEGLTRARVLAAATRLLDEGFFRIGSECYAEENQSYGLTTLRKEHARIEGEAMIFDFPAKSGKRRLQAIVDDEVRDVVAALLRRRGGGDALWVCRRDDGGRRQWCEIHSDDVNAYIRDRAGVDCSAKDFRTWSATVLAAVALSVSTRARSEAGRKRCVARAMKEVAHYLGNTPAVVRKSYVDPRVVDRFHRGDTVADAITAVAADNGPGQMAIQGAVEEAVLDLIEPATPSARAA